MGRRGLALLVILAGCAHAHASNLGSGKASWYGPGFAGKPTASGVPFRPTAMTAAHKTLPFGTIVKVTRVDNGKSVEVVINDRGPFVEGRVIDLSKAAARKLDMLDDGVAKVTLERLGCDKKFPKCSER